MAAIADTHTATEHYAPYQRPPDRQVVRTAIPRGLRSFVVPTEVLAEKPINDTILVAISWTMPTQFAYVLNELHANIEADTITDFQRTAYVRFANTSPQLQGMRYRWGLPLVLSAVGSTVDSTLSISTDARLLSRTPIILSAPSTFTIVFTNRAAAAQAAGTIDGVISFFEYDLEQVSWVAANQGVAVLTR